MPKMIVVMFDFDSTSDEVDAKVLAQVRKIVENASTTIRENVGVVILNVTSFVHEG